VRWVWERSGDQPLPDYDLVLAEASKLALRGDATA
jgi:hypothetical protein